MLTWPDDGSKIEDRGIDTSEKQAHWQKWINLYNAKMLSRGKFHNLYTYGYDLPEGYAIDKDNRMYYAFYAPDKQKPVVWSNRVARTEARPLRGR